MRKVAALGEKIIEVGSSKPSTCPNCGHWRSAHLKGRCALCAMAGLAISNGETPQLPTQLMESYLRLGPVAFDCRERFETLAPALMEQARLAPKNAYHPEMPCKECGQAWMVHTGYLCPGLLSLFVPALKESDPAFITG